MSGVRRARSPLSIADEVFASLQRGPDPLALRPADLVGPDLAGGDIPGLSRHESREPIPLARVQVLLCRAGTPMSVKNRAWSALVARAQQQGGAWTVGAVGVALPKLVRLATELSNGDREGRPELDTEILSGFLQGLTSVDPESTSLFPVLLRHARRAGVAWLRHQRAADALISDSEHTSAPPHQPWGHPDLVLVNAVAAGVITTAEAVLIGATRLEDVTPAVIAASEQVSVWAVLKRRRRAEQRLAAYLTEQITHTDDPTADAATRATSPVDAARAVGRTDCPKPVPSRPFYQRGAAADPGPRGGSDTRRGTGGVA